MRDTFMKVGQSLMVKKQLVTEKSLKEKMIHSVMPPKVADWLMKETHAEGEGEEFGQVGGGGRLANKRNSHHQVGMDNDWSDDDYDSQSESCSMVRKPSSPRTSNQGGGILQPGPGFRSFNMNAMDDVR